VTDVRGHDEVVAERAALMKEREVEKRRKAFWVAVKLVATGTFAGLALLLCFIASLVNVSCK
jgi:hypothetical protein